MLSGAKPTAVGLHAQAETSAPITAAWMERTIAHGSALDSQRLILQQDNCQCKSSSPTCLQSIGHSQKGILLLTFHIVEKYPEVAGPLKALHSGHSRAHTAAATCTYKPTVQQCHWQIPRAVLRSTEGRNPVIEQFCCAPDADVVAQEGRRVQDHEAVPAALYGEGQAARDTVQGVGVRNIRRLLQKQVAVRVARHPDVIELHGGLRLIRHQMNRQIRLQKPNQNRQR